MSLTPSKPKVRFFFQGVTVKLPNRALLKKFIVSIFKKEQVELESINYIFCSDTDLLKINRQFLQHDFYTDIITFNLSEKSSIRAEVYISIDRVKDNARCLGIAIKYELHRVLFHGTLHLCGYQDKIKKDIFTMRKRENYYLSSYFNK